MTSVCFCLFVCGGFLRPKNEFWGGLLGLEARRHGSKKHLNCVPVDYKMGPNDWYFYKREIWIQTHRENTM